MVEPGLCLGCGGRHFANEALCPRTKRPVGEGPFGSLVGPYRVGKLLGSGGFGAVHVAEDTRSGASVALKLLHPELVAEPELLDRFVREAEVTVRAGNPHIVRVLEASFSGRSVYVALELLEGETLASIMRAGPLPAERAIDIALQMLDGLAVAHAAGVIHRDIKPANVFLADEPGAPRSLVKLLDFGIGRMLVTAPAQRLTRTGTQLGTPHFMAPEQVKDAKRADPRADLYAVAVTLFAMLSGERPYGAIAVGDWVAAVARRTPARRVSSPIEELPMALIDAIAVGLAVDPAQRFQDAGAFARALIDAAPEGAAPTRQLPALAAEATFNTAGAARRSTDDGALATTRDGALVTTRDGALVDRARSDRAHAADIPDTRSRVDVSRGAARTTSRNAVIIIGALLIALVLGVAAAAALGVFAYSQRGNLGVAAANDAPGSPEAVMGPVPVGEPIPTPAGLGVHFREPMPYASADLDVRTATAVIQASHGEYERCRVVGRATHASITVTVAAGSGDPIAWQPNPFAPNDREASECLGATFNRATRGVRFGVGGSGGMFIVSADLDAR